jgi:molybdopterin converting factor small subunit
MKVKILFFGATADAVGEREISMWPSNGDTTGDVFGSVIATYPQLQGHKLLFSINKEFSSGSEAVSDGDELAIFTAVSGG